MFLTLAIPNLNGAAFLPATLESLETNRPAVHWWLQDGGSTDASIQIARKHSGAGDTIVTNERDDGQADALNRAFARMGGEVIGYINSDDLLTRGAAEAVLSHFQSHPESDLAYGEIEWIDSAGNTTGHHAGRIDSPTEVLDIYRVWWRRRQWVQPEVFLRRSLWERVGPFDTRYRLAFDYDYWVRCFLAGARVSRIPRVLARFRIHANQKSRASDLASREIRTIVESHLSNANVSGSLVRRLRSELDYDRYRLREPPYDAGKTSFARYLLAHPGAFAARAVRERVRISCVKALRLSNIG